MNLRFIEGFLFYDNHIHALKCVTLMHVKLLPRGSARESEVEWVSL